MHICRSVEDSTTLEVYYTTLEVAQHNVRTLNTRTEAVPAGCGCTGGVEVCPLEGHCKEESVVYGAEVTKTEDNTKETYTGLTGGQFKKRWFKHKYSFEDTKKRTETTLSKHIWKLKDKNKLHSVPGKSWPKPEPLTLPTRCGVCALKISFLLCSTLKQLL